jgi:hypothetical protein
MKEDVLLRSSTAYLEVPGDFTVHDVSFWLDPTTRTAASRRAGQAERHPRTPDDAAPGQR